MFHAIYLRIDVLEETISAPADAAGRSSDTMTTQLLRQALAVAHDPQATNEQLLEVIGDLLALGDLASTEAVLGRLRANGSSAPVVPRLEKHLARLRGQESVGTPLLAALAILRNHHATDEQLLKAADSLVVWGALDEADLALDRLRERNAYPGPVARLSAASRQLRRSGILTELQTLTPQQSLNKPYEVLIRRRDGAERVIIVFTGMALRFWLSLNALDHFLRRFDAHVIYLSDHSATMYLNGLANIGPGYDNLLRTLEKHLNILAVREVLVLASSAGGFVGLRAAVDLQARRFAGMSIRTTFSPSSSLLMSPLEERAIASCRYPEMLIDLRPVIEASTYPLSIQLYCGDRSKLDAAHAKNLAGIPRVEVNYLKDYGAHDAISGLIAAGEFERVLQRFVTGAAETDLVQAHRA
jgi:hypothetical protein